MTAYAIPARTVKIESIVVNSRFLATIGYADTVEKAKSFIQAVRDKMPDASHHVYAFKVGYGSSVIEGMSDDGEPSGTAGPPVLAVLRGADIGDTVIVVTRYFGGTKLGTGGLVRAYGGAAKEAVGALPVQMRVEKHYLGITLAYSFYERLLSLLEDCDAKIDSEEFDVQVTIYAFVPVPKVPELTISLKNLTAGQAELIILAQNII